MPLDDLVEFGVRLAFHGAVDGAMSRVAAVGSGQSRRAAVARALLRIVGLAVSAAMPWLFTREDLSFSILLPTLVFAAVGAWLSWQLVADLRQLQFWGEPQLTAGRAGLKIPVHGVIGWNDIAFVTPSIRHGRGQVCITASGRRADKFAIDTSDPDTLAVAIRAAIAEKGVHS